MCIKDLYNCERGGRGKHHSPKMDCSVLRCVRFKGR